MLGMKRWRRPWPRVQPSSCAAGGHSQGSGFDRGFANHTIRSPSHDQGQYSTDTRVLVGIDISKNRDEVLIAVPGKTRRRRMTMLDTADDDQHLIEIMRSFGLPVTIGFEATGNDHRALMFALGAAGFEVKLVSSIALARTREALHNNSWDKKNPKDAHVILHMLEFGAVQILHDPLMAGTSDVRELSKTSGMVARAKTEVWHRILTHDLPLCFPEADRFQRSSRGEWFLAFLEAFPSSRIATAMEKDAFIAAAWPVIGRRVSTSALLADICKTSKTSVGLPVALDPDAIHMFRLMLAQGRSLIQQRNAIEARASDLLGDHPDDPLLRSIPGIGPVNALAVPAEAGDLRRFRHHRQFLKFCGTDPATMTPASSAVGARYRRTATPVSAARSGSPDRPQP
jgi:transposase